LGAVSFIGTFLALLSGFSFCAALRVQKAGYAARRDFFLLGVCFSLVVEAAAGRRRDAKRRGPRRWRWYVLGVARAGAAWRGKVFLDEDFAVARGERGGRALGRNGGCCGANEARDAMCASAAVERAAAWAKKTC